LCLSYEWGGGGGGGGGKGRKRRRGGALFTGFNKKV